MKFKATIIEAFILSIFFSFSSGEKTSGFFKKLGRFSRISQDTLRDFDGRFQVDDPACFSGQTRFLSRTSATKVLTKPAASLRYGDYVQAFADGKVSFQKIIGFSKRNVTTDAVFKKLYLQNRTLEITGNHLIMVENVDNLVYAESLKVGDRLLTIKETPQDLNSISHDSTSFILEKILKIETVVSKGFVTPITASGTLLPEGILASCFASSGGENGEMSLIDEVLKYRVFTYLTVVMPLQIRDYFVDIETIDRQNDSDVVCDPMECDPLIKTMWKLGSVFRKTVADVSGILKNFNSVKMSSEL